MEIVNIFKTYIFLGVVAGAFADLPCIPRDTNDSIICICNATYCDTVTRETPTSGYYTTYTTSRAGSRFRKYTGTIEPINETATYEEIYKLNASRKYQFIHGFGGAVTDSAGYNYNSLPSAMQDSLIKSYCGESGIEYNLLRLAIGSTDFSLRHWTYNELPVNDTTLSNFTLSEEDINYRIPMIQACQDASAAEVKFISSIWNPPTWMLAVDDHGFSYVLKEFYQTFADYNCKFAELFQKQNITMWAMSPANEPLIAVMFEVTDDTTFWTTPQMANYIGDYYGPTIKNCSVSNIKILAGDDQRFTMPLWYNRLIQTNSKVPSYVDGFATRFYVDNETSPAVMSRSFKDYPEKFVISTEACVSETKPPEGLGAWYSARKITVDILEILNHNGTGWVDWNLCLNTNGGPARQLFVDSPIIVDADKGEFYKGPMYYVIGQFAKFIPRDSQRIKVVKSSDSNLDYQDIAAMGQEFFDNVAFVTPRNTTVVIIHNNGISKDIAIQYCRNQISITLEAESVTTVEFPWES